MPKDQACMEFVRIALGSRHLVYAHYGCAQVAVQLLKDLADPQPIELTVYSLRPCDSTGLPIGYRDLECFLSHEEDTPDEL